jgi:Bifunctional DNA primase/polymerase, N-terminal
VNAQHVWEARASLARFQALGLAVLPVPYRRKGCLVKGWPTLPAQESWDLSLREVLRTKGRINLAARTGWSENGYFCAAIDLDRGDTLERLPLITEAYGRAAVIAAVKTGPLHSGSPGRGLHVWLRLPEPIPTSAFESGEVFGIEKQGRGHLCMLPPSRHPTGITYEWTAIP